LQRLNLERPRFLFACVHALHAEIALVQRLMRKNRTAEGPIQRSKDIGYCNVHRNQNNGSFSAGRTTATLVSEDWSYTCCYIGYNSSQNSLKNDVEELTTSRKLQHNDVIVLVRKLNNLDKIYLTNIRSKGTHVIRLESLDINYRGSCSTNCV